REGVDALKRLYPAQRRLRTELHALEAVNTDGHKWDVFCRWPDDTIGRPVTIAFQDLYSNMTLAWRTARAENTATALLAFGDLVETFGIPDHLTLDNGRSFASKWLSGGKPNRYRFAVKDSDPVGVLTQLGVDIHWTTPYSGQSKPIERMFRDFAQSIAKDIRFAGAWAGNTVDAKPENYASKAVPIDVFETVIAEKIAEHNARAGRRTAVCRGKLSFEAAFRLSYQDQAIIRRARPEQRRLWLLAAEAATVRRQDGSLHFEGNRYWHDSLLEYLGKKVVIRFDADDLHAGLFVYRLDGAFIAEVPCIDDIGFYSKAEGQAANRARRTWMRAQKEASQTRFSLDDLVALMPSAPEPVEPPQPRIVQIYGNRAVKAAPAPDYDQDEVMDSFGRGVRALRLVSENENAADD
ncbi:MAG: transposase, partial [Rhizobiales bacterium]|nr:transposase [Hyphomicrobiales bacterium]